MKKVFLLFLFLCVLCACEKTDNPKDPNENIATEIQTLMAGKVIAVLYLRSTDETIDELLFYYPVITFTDTFLVIDGLDYISLESITQFSVNPLEAEYSLEIITSPE